MNAQEFAARAVVCLSWLPVTPLLLVYGLVWGVLAVAAPNAKRKMVAFVLSCEPGGVLFVLLLLELTLASLIFIFAVTVVYIPIGLHTPVSLGWSDAPLATFTASYNGVRQWGMAGSAFDVTLNCPSLNERRRTDVFVTRDGTMRASTRSEKDTSDGLRVYDVDDSPHSVRVFEVDLDISFDAAPIPSVFVVKDAAVAAYVLGRIDAADLVWVDTATRTPFLEFHRRGDAEWSMRCMNASVAETVLTPAMAAAVLASVSFRSFEPKNPCDAVYTMSFVLAIVAGMCLVFVTSYVLERRSPVTPVEAIDEVVATPPPPAPPLVVRPERCCVCHERQLSMIAMPCRHLALCAVCAREAGNRCPVCRARVGFMRETPNLGFHVFVSGVAEQ